MAPVHALPCQWWSWLAAAPPAAARRPVPSRRAPHGACASASRAADGGVCGIDLGTTNSAVAVVVDGAAVIVPDADGHRTTPSVVAYLPTGEVLVGRAAQAHGLREPQNTFASVKRFIGRKHGDVIEDASRVLFKLTAAPDGAVGLACPALGGRTLRPEEVSAHVVREMLQIAARATGSLPSRAVITVPAYFNDAQRRATEAAGLAAGLARVKLLREPVAAALAYGVGHTGDATVLVVDLGGGTFDVSLLDVGGGVVEVLATSGDAHLGGDDFDDALARWLAGRVGAGASPKRLQLAGRALREALTERDAITARVAPGERGTVALSRAEMEALCEPLLARLRRPIEQASWAAGIDLHAARQDAADHEAAEAATATRSKGGGKRARRAADRPATASKVPSRQRAPGAAFPQGRAIDDVILVGGATRMPAVQRVVAAMTARPVALGGVDPDEAVALGAALHAGSLEGSVRDAETIEVWQAALMRALARKHAEEVRQGAESDVDDEQAEDDGDAEKVSFVQAATAGPLQGEVEPSRLPAADEMEDLLSYEAHVSGDSLPLDALTERAAHFAARIRSTHVDASATDDEFEGMDLEEIAALGLTEESVVDDEVTTVEDLRALRAALGEDAFARLTPVPPPSAQPQLREPRLTDGSDVGA